MNLTNFIKKLQQIEAADPDNGNLPVCLADWQEALCEPNEEVAEHIKVVTGGYVAENVPGHDGDGKFVIIGDDDYEK